MTPITKNVFVVDEQGNQYEPTYPKRAKALVKNGRARFVAENTICLACPPDDMDTEDNTMPEQIPENKNPQDTPQYSVEYILRQLAAIQAQSEHISAVLSEAWHATMTGEKLTALSEAICAREATNQQLLQMYERMYDALVPLSPDKIDRSRLEWTRWQAIERLAAVAFTEDDFAEERAQMLESIRLILRENK